MRQNLLHLSWSLLFVSLAAKIRSAPVGSQVASSSVGSSTLSAPPGGFVLQASSETVHWGYTYAGLEPAIAVNSGDEILVETSTQHAGDDFEKMIQGDPGIEDIYYWGPEGPRVSTRGRTGKGDGVHVLTGPIYVCGAEPGDVLQVDILDITPRVNPSTNKTYGSNAAASWGYQFRAGFLDGRKREVVTIYEIIKDEDSGDVLWAVPDYQFEYGNYLNTSQNAAYQGPYTTCVDTSGNLGSEELPDAWSNAQNQFRNNLTVPCVNGMQQWQGLYYPGLITPHPTGTEDYSIRGKFKVPVNFHIGNMIVAAATNYTVDSVPPSKFGGNVDDRRMGKGATMYYPVEVAGAMLALGDCHTAQGDSEFDGTAIETSVNAELRLTVLKADSLPAPVQDLQFPLLENVNEYVVHGFTYPDYTNQLESPFSAIYQHSTLDLTMTVAYNLTRDFMMRTFDLTEDQAITAITTLVDFGITQVVDGNWGIHATIPKWPFSNDTTPYAPSVFPGSKADVKVSKGDDKGSENPSEEAAGPSVLTQELGNVQSPASVWLPQPDVSEKNKLRLRFLFITLTLGGRLARQLRAFGRIPRWLGQLTVFRTQQVVLGNTINKLIGVFAAGIPVIVLGGFGYQLTSGKTLWDGIVSVYGALYKIPGMMQIGTRAGPQP
ncbi:hypothetical protein WJX84_007001 [Apatococcus fuscideae]|uniref:Formamidase n=1 Tax=Apatococcus fuscideae TaxID=2026836 RepID=A0AAW1S945_9CHLO